VLARAARLAAGERAGLDLNAVPDLPLAAAPERAGVAGPERAVVAAPERAWRSPGAREFK
jgi:hypothetical protein